MALSDSDVELIRASWIPARKDPVGAGVLLFKGLFTKLPDYLRFFSQFSDLDLESIQENKRLIKHAVKVIDTVTFVVDSIGDQTKGDLLNEALVNLVRGHLKRRIGPREFRNLGIVLIDFICGLNNRRHPIVRLHKCGAGGTSSSASSSQDSDTMTCALDKIRASSSPSSSSEGENLILMVGGSVSADPLEQLDSVRENNIHSNCFANHDNQHDHHSRGAHDHDHDHDHDHHQDQHQPRHGHHVEEEQGGDHNQNGPNSGAAERRRQVAKLDTSLLVAAWTKLYGTILDLVESEETNQASQ